MKELYKAKRIDNGEWVEGGSIINAQDGSMWIIPTNGIIKYAFDSKKLIYAEAIPVIPETKCRHTGLTDKNGKKIFEGDICKTYFESYTHSWEEVGVVTEFCGAYGIESAYGKHFRAFINESVYTRSHEVIGNIHDNPELLEAMR